MSGIGLRDVIAGAAEKGRCGELPLVVVLYSAKTLPPLIEQLAPLANADCSSILPVEMLFIV
jgi:hypothetical protein